MDSKSLVKSAIISCSRRTDVPAFLMDWVVERIKAGYVSVVNPFNKKQVSQISLYPKDVKCWVWWSKDFGNWIDLYEKNKEIFKKYKAHIFQFTINSPSELESNVNISLKKRFDQVKYLIDEFSVEAISYRFDPIILYKKKASNKIESNLNKFEYIIENLTSLGLSEMIFSFATIYPKVRKRMITRGFVPIDIDLIKKKEIVERLIKICDNYDMRMKACCQPDLLEIHGIEQAHCIDAYKIEKIVGESISKTRDTGQRTDCGCFKSRDIGGYTGMFRCKHNCHYCYASPAKK